MQAITTIGLDIAKSVFQVHGVDAEGNVILRRQLKRRYVLAFFQKLPPCLVGIEACASSHSTAPGFPEAVSFEVTRPWLVWPAWRSSVPRLLPAGCCRWAPAAGGC